MIYLVFIFFKINLINFNSTELVIVWNGKIIYIVAESTKTSTSIMTY